MERKIDRIIHAVDTSDGAGVKLKRSLGQSGAARLDPLLMLDEFFSDEPADYLAGFPSHPHRGFETVTYILDGHMLHEDHMGNRGDLKSGGVQWMRAGRGIIHSEMPQQTEGRMRGFQLWINLPADEKMQAPWYEDVSAASIPVYPLDGGGTVKLIAGSLASNGLQWQGYINGLDKRSFSTNPIYADLQLPTGRSLALEIPLEHHAAVYVYEGSVELAGKTVNAHQAAFLSLGDTLSLTAATESKVLLIAARPLKEPIVQYGPFVMNSNEEIEQTLRDYRDGQLAI